MRGNLWGRPSRIALDNDAIVLTGSRMPRFPLGSVLVMWLTSWELISAASLVAGLPPVAMFFTLQRQLISGLTFGARPAALR